MDNITLEKIDILKNRFKISYSEAKETLEICNGNVVEALIYLEKNNSKINKEQFIDKDEVVQYIKRLVEKGNATRIKIKKDDEVIIDMPLNGVLITGAISALYPKLLALITATLTAAVVVTKVTIEITKEDGSVEVINKLIKNGFKEAKDTVIVATEGIRETMSDVSTEIKTKVNNTLGKEEKLNENMFSYKVNLEN